MHTESGITERRRVYYGWIIVAICLFVIGITFGAHYTFGVFLIHFRESLGSTSAIVSGAYSLAVFCYMFFGAIAGWGVDRYGPKITTILGGVFLGLGLSLTSRVTTVGQLYVSYGMVGMGMGPSYTPLVTTVSRWFNKKRGLALGIVTAGIGIGPLIMAPLASYLILKTEWRHAYFIIACTAWLIIPAAFFLKRSPGQASMLPDGEELNSREPEIKVQGKGPQTGSGGFSFREAIRTKAFWLLAAIYFTIGLSLHTVMAHVVAYSQRRGLPPMTAATVMSTISGFSIAGRMIMGIVSDWIGRKRGLAVCFCCEGLLIYWLTACSDSRMFFLFAICYGFFYGGHVPQMPALVGETLGLAHMGIVLGAASLLWGVGGAIGPVFAGHMVDTTGSYALAFIAGGTAIILGGVMALMVEKPQSIR